MILDTWILLYLTWLKWLTGSEKLNKMSSTVENEHQGMIPGEDDYDGPL